jgi:serine/threonine protein kinase
MWCLQSFVPPIVHRDLRSPNIFLVSLDENAPVVAKVADFGLAAPSEGKLGRLLSTWQWVAPEILDPKRRTGGYDWRSDVYSFGIVMYEIATRRFPFEDDHGEKFRRGIGVDHHAFIDAIINEDLRPIIEENNPPLYCLNIGGWADYCKLMTRCWDPELGMRLAQYFCFEHC